jgi:hypothetical protein
MAGALLLVALLVSNFWFTIGITGIAYMFTVPVTGIFFLKGKARYERMQPMSAQMQG